MIDNYFLIAWWRKSITRPTTPASVVWHVMISLKVIKVTNGARVTAGATSRLTKISRKCTLVFPLEAHSTLGEWSKEISMVKGPTVWAAGTSWGPCSQRMKMKKNQNLRFVKNGGCEGKLKAEEILLNQIFFMNFTSIDFTEKKSGKSVMPKGSVT